MASTHRGRGWLAALTLLSALGGAPERAEACGGCFIQGSENTQVTSHRMILSLSSTETTLWDQIVYDGAPESFAWVLPTRGEVEIGLSSDRVFQALEGATTVTVASPLISCGSGRGSGAPAAAEDSDGSATGSGKSSDFEDPVTVVAHEVVGPFETVQLQSTDPDALNLWLTDHGYAIPSDVQPIIASYVAEGFNFLALRLSPGEGVDAMRPVRVTSQGASPSLPLRMVAAGTGAKTPISLWVLGEGRYSPANMASFEIHESDLVWDWDASASNYIELRQAGFDASNGASWLVEAAEPLDGYLFDQLAVDGITSPLQSGYGGVDGQGAGVEAAEDREALIGALDRESLFVTRLFAELSRAALATDLELEAGEQGVVARALQTERTVGTEPTCPSNPPGGGGAGGDEGALGASSCAFEGPPREPLPFGIALGLFALSRWRRRRRGAADSEP